MSPSAGTRGGPRAGPNGKLEARSGGSAGEPRADGGSARTPEAGIGSAPGTGHWGGSVRSGVSPTVTSGVESRGSRTEPGSGVARWAGASWTC